MLYSLHKNTYNSKGLCLVSVSSVAWKSLLWNEEIQRWQRRRVVVVDDDDDDDDNDVGRTLGECRAVAHHGLVGADADAVAAQMCSLLRSLEDDT